MDDSLQLILDLLTSAHHPAPHCNLDENLTALRSRLTVLQFLNWVLSAPLSCDQFVTLTSAVLNSASVEWLMPEIEHSSQDVAAENSLSGDVSEMHLQQLYSNLTAELCKNGCMGSLVNEEETCEDLKKKFSEKTGIACTVMTTFSHLLRNVYSMRTSGGKTSNRTVRNVVRILSCGGLVMCLEHEPACRWSTPESVECANSLLVAVCAANGCDALESLLNMTDGKFSLLQSVLNEVLPKLTRDAWKLNPAVSHVFRHCLLAVRQPLLSDCLAMFLPPTLLFIDDFETDNRLSGLHCLRHMLQHASRTELRWYGRADVIYDSLLRAWFGCDHVTLEAVILCLLDVLDVIEVSPHRAAGPKPWGKHDEAFEKFLTNMEMESKIPFRRVYAKYLGTIVSKLGITAVRHLTRLVCVVTDYLQVSDGPEEQCRSDVLKALSTVLSETWPRIPGHADDVMKALVRLLYDIRSQDDSMSSSARLDLQRQALGCVRLLKNICPEYSELNDEFFSLHSD